jgi:endonuclease YncB( thermonuclease family)
VELFPILAIIGVVAVFALLSGSSKPEGLPDSKPEADVRPKLSPVPSSIEKPAPFDATTAQQAKGQRTLTGAVYVTDGDTITIKKTQIRLFGIDAPELDHPYGKKAKWALHKLCKGQTVRAEIKETDAYGRTVAQCFLPDGRDLSAEMVRMGLAIDWPKFSGGKYAAMEARDARKKLFLADARQKGNMFVWERFEARQSKQ